LRPSDRWEEVDMEAHEPAATKRLRKFLLEKSAESYRFGMLLYWFLTASVEAHGVCRDQSHDCSRNRDTYLLVSMV
jgi:hypothetical protein